MSEVKGNDIIYIYMRSHTHTVYTTVYIIHILYIHTVHTEMYIYIWYTYVRIYIYIHLYIVDLLGGPLEPLVS